jgi:L-rhamnose-H+ transport protein
MSAHIAFLLVFGAGFLQGTFVLPMTLTKGWRWEHTWAVFSLLGMFLFNWLFTLLTIPQIFSIYGAVPSSQIMVLALFGVGWGVGAILFGIGMAKLGMALGYPIIMGLIASLGALVPMVMLFPASIVSLKGAAVIGGTLITVAGIVLCSYAASSKTPRAGHKDGAGTAGLRSGIIVAIFAGALSCLPNVGMVLAGPLISSAQARGVSRNLSANAVWALFFTVGFLINFSYCLTRIAADASLKEYFGPPATRNVLLCGAMALMWIGSFNLYGLAYSGLGSWGAVAGWPLFISTSILVGNVWGLWRGEWRQATRRSKSLLFSGLAVLLLAIVSIAWSNTI